VIFCRKNALTDIWDRKTNPYIGMGCAYATNLLEANPGRRHDNRCQNSGCHCGWKVRRAAVYDKWNSEEGLVGFQEGCGQYFYAARRNLPARLL